MTGAGLALPIPVYKYRGMPFRDAVGICTGCSGFSVGRHVHIMYGNVRVRLCAVVLKMLIYGAYAYYVVLLHKMYLDYGHLDGVARLQLQHPVEACNPLDPKGCPTAFKNVTDLHYCTQNPNHEPNAYPCKYMDAFDMAVRGEIPHQTLFIPTRVTTYIQNEDCTKVSDTMPCPENIKMRKNSTVYAANVEDFTLLVDHSFVSDELNVEMSSWSMLGFVNPCGVGAQLDERVFGETRDALKGQLRSMKVARNKHCSEEEREFRAVAASDKALEKDGVDETTIDLMKRGLALWLNPGWRTLLGKFFTIPYEEIIEEERYKKHKAKFHKLPNGDFVKISDLLELAGESLDHPASDKNRFEGLVLILSIEYENVKENSWPNSVPPAYFYSAWIAPSREYKVMQEMMGQKRFEKPGYREITDAHGIFVVVKQGGHIGAFSFSRLIFLFVIFMAIDSLYRSVFLLCIFNCKRDYGKKKRDDPDAELELDKKVTYDFYLQGSKDDSEDSESDSLEAESLVSERIK